MADEIDAGKIVAEIVLETQQARENAEEITETLDNIASKVIKPQIDYETLSYIKGSLEKMGITGQEMVDTLNTGFGNITGAKKYRVALEEIALKIDECRTKIQALNVGDNIDSGAVENYSDALTQLEEQYDKVLAKLDAYVAKTVATVQKTKDIENEINKLSGLNTPTVVDNSTMLKAQSYEDTIVYIQGVLEKLKITGKDADHIISACFQDVSSLRKYQNELEVIASKLDTERKKYQELSDARYRAEKRGDYSSVDKITSAMDNQVNKIKTLEAQFDSVYEKQDNAVKKTVTAYQKQSSAAQSAQVKQDKLNEALDNKQAGKNFAGGINLATTSLRTFNSIAPDAVDGIGEIITQVNAAKQAMTAGASAPLAWGTAIVAGIGVVASLVINEIQKVQQAEEEARQKAAEAAEESKSSREELNNLSNEYTSLKTKLDMATLSHGEEIEIKSNLLDLQKKLVEKYGEEAKSIDLVSGSLSEQREEIKKLAKEKADQYLLENESAYNNAEKKLQETTEYSIASASKPVPTIATTGLLYDLNNLNTKYRSKEVTELIVEKFGNDFPVIGLPGEEVKIKISNEEALSKLKELKKEIEQLGKEKGIDVQSDLDILNKSINEAAEKEKNELNDYLSTIAEYEKQKEISKNGGEESKNFFETINDTMSNSIDKVEGYANAMSDLSSAYQTVSSGEKLNADSLSQLIEKYPELAEYVNQTGDLTLKNGEKIKEVFESQKKSLISTLEEEKRELEKQSNSYAGMSIFREEQKQIKDRISEINAELAIYNSELTELNENSASVDWSSIASEVKSLSSAYKTVSEDGELDASTLQSLCKQYPDLAKYISETGDLTLKNGEKIKEAYEEEQQALIDKLTAKKKELELEMESSKDKDKVKKDLAQINAELEIYKNLQIESNEEELNWSSMSNEIKNLSSAYQTLNEGKQLDVDTMIQLIDKYPAVATAMANEGKLGKEQANVLKQLFEAKKSDYILTQKRTIANLQASEEEADGVIKSVELQIAAYKNLNQIKGFSAISDFMTESLNSTKEKQLKNKAEIQEKRKQAQARIKAMENLDVDTYGKSGGGSDNSNKALANELKQLEHKKAIGQLTSKQEYNWLVRINNKYRKNADEQMDMEKRLYNAKKQMQADEEAANTKALQAAYKGIENKKSLGKMNSQQELRQLEQIRQRYKMTAEERMELEIKIYNLKKSLKDDEISSINTLANAVTEALKQKYEEQRKLEEDRINESIESWQNWEDKTVSAIQGEIDALDELAKKQDSENKRQEYENKRQQTELQLAYEKDDYNRTQLQKELARLDKEEAERLAEEQREAQKKVLEGRIEAVKGQSQATQERLKKKLDEVGEKYDKLTDSFSLKAQAQKFIADSTQKQIVSLIKSYASDYEIAGNTIGDALYNGMKAKMDNISAYVDGVFGKIEAYQRQMANTANASADRFWASQNSPQASQKQTASKSVTVQQTVNFNRPIESPVETRRQLDRTNQALAKQISSGI